VLFLPCASLSGVLFSVGVCVGVCDLLIFLHPPSGIPGPRHRRVQLQRPGAHGAACVCAHPGESVI